MLEFYRTAGGRRLCDATLPEIARQMKRLADEMHKANMLKEQELGMSLRPITPGDLVKEFIEGKGEDDSSSNSSGG